MSDAVSRALVWVPVALAVAVAMDLWAMFLHGRVWHGLLWRVHVTHHTSRRGRFELNDVFSLLHAPIAVALILYGARAAPSTQREIAFGVGVGMTLFGLAYLVVHDGLVHGRLPVRFLLRVPALKRVADAHRVHHAGVFGGPPYGLFCGPLELARHRRALRRGDAEPGAASVTRARAPVTRARAAEPTTRGAPAPR